MPNANPTLQRELLISPLPFSPSIFFLRPVPVGEIIVGAASATPDADKVIVETIYDKFKSESKTLKKQAKNSEVAMFSENIFPKVFDMIARGCYVE